MEYTTNCTTARVETHDLEKLVSQEDVADFIEFEFKITGMTCVACSGSIERLMHNEFDSKGMRSVAIVLLTHKMTTVFDASSFTTKKVTPEMICDEIDMIGFGAELNGMVEISAEDNQPNKKHKIQINKDLASSFASIDSAKMRGEESDNEIMENEETSTTRKNLSLGTPSKIVPAKNFNDNKQQIKKTQTSTIKSATFEIPRRLD